jgi:hypothetical protein
VCAGRLVQSDASRRISLTDPSTDQASLHDYVTSSTTSTSAEPSISLLDDILPGGLRPGTSRPFNISTRLIWNCAAHDCFEVNNLTLCPTCKAAQYCSRKHLYADRPNHRSVCAKIKKAYANLDHSSFNPERSALWTNGQSDYMGLHQVLVENLLKMNTAQAVTMALQHLLDMLRLQPSDKYGAHDVVPALFIRLGRDQEAYNLCHWWATKGHAPDWDWATTNERYIDTKDADAFEGVEAFIGDRFHLSNAVVITLSKLRLVIDLQSLQRARTFAGPHVPREILDVIQYHSTLSAITSNEMFTDCEGYTLLIERLREQVRTLFEAIHKANKHFWPALVEPGDNLQARPTAWEQGDERQMQLALQHNYNAWAETPGAIDAIEALLERVTRF